MMHKPVVSEVTITLKDSQPFRSRAIHSLERIGQ